MVQKNSFASRRDYWHKHILAHQVSGQTRKDYCQQHNLKLDHFCYAKYPISQIKVIFGAAQLLYQRKHRQAPRLQRIFLTANHP